MTREQKLALIWRYTHKDFRGKFGGRNSVLALRIGGTCLVPLEELTDTEIEDRLPYAVKQSDATKESAVRRIHERHNDVQGG